MHIAELDRLLAEAVRAHERGDLATAAAFYDRVLSAQPEQADALHLLGVIADQQGRHDDAVALIRRAIAVSPGAAIFHGNLATALLSRGDMGGAEAAYRQALRLDPGYVDGQLNLANLLVKRGETDDALELYHMAGRMAPRRADVQLGLATALFNSGRDADALPHVVTALQLDPSSAAARNLAALALCRNRNYADAVAQARLAVALAPDEIAYRENLAIALVKARRPEWYEEAIRLFRTVLEKEPDRLESLVGIGSALVQNQQPMASMPYFERALSIDDKRIEPLVNYAVPLTYSGRFDEALRYCNRALEIAPDNSLVLTQRGTVREYVGEYEGALSDYEAAQRATGDPDALTEAAFKQSLLQLARGNLSQGWPLYTARRGARSAQASLAVFETLLPKWDGVTRPGLRLLVWGEQGVGDQILYGSMLPDLLARGLAVTLLCDPRLMPLFARSFPALVLRPLDPARADELRGEADVQISLGDLGSMLRPDLDAFPAAQAYLRPDMNKAAAFRRQYEAYGRRLIVGITWRSRAPTGIYKSAALLDWAPVLQQQDILFVDMQYGDTEDERRLARDRLGIEILHDPQVDPLKDLDGFAAQAAAMDLVIGGSNSGQHIAAATGTECWIAVPGGTGRLWYWFLDRDDSPWYPGVRLFRQRPGRFDDWRAPVVAMAEALQKRLRHE